MNARTGAENYAGRRAIGDGEAMTHNLQPLIGDYEGDGRWTDELGATGSYQITQSISRADNGLKLSFRHIFDNDDPEVNAEFLLTWTATPFFNVCVGEAVLGKGYAFDDFCHYMLEMPATVVEANYFLTEGGLRVYGSSSRNADGNAIAWREQLRRVAS